MSYARQIITEFAKPVPRYTSYPTAPHFNEAIQQKQVKKWMSKIDAETPISIYIHIPFCDRLCWFCGCHTKHTLKYEPVKRYLKDLHKELALAKAAIGRKQRIRHLHLGGGSPSLLKPQELTMLKDVLKTNFQFEGGTEISLEFDPTDLNEEALKAFVDFGVTRASLGVQDFNPKVQKAINRSQTFEQTQWVIETLRTYGVSSLNIDALYGLPFQTLSTLKATLERVAALSPDSIALFGYAHVPWVKPHQKLIKDDSLPDMYERFQQARFAEKFLSDSDYLPIGMDHFSKCEDSLATALREQRLHRNFQGYTTDNCQTLLGFGVSSISQFPQGYTQNVKDTHSYRRSVIDGILPTQRGIILSQKDKIIAKAIEELMCYFTLTPTKLLEEFGPEASFIITEAEILVKRDKHGYFRKDENGFTLSHEGRPFARSMAAHFDEYLNHNPSRYSVAV